MPCYVLFLSTSTWEVLFICVKFINSPDIFKNEARFKIGEIEKLNLKLKDNKYVLLIKVI